MGDKQVAHLRPRFSGPKCVTQGPDCDGGVPIWNLWSWPRSVMTLAVPVRAQRLPLHHLRSRTKMAYKTGTSVSTVATSRPLLWA